MKINSLEFKELQSELQIQFKKFCNLEILSVNEKPQLRYKNINNHPYLKGINQNTTFCRFKPDLPKCSGLYLWVVDNEIVYIGQAVDLRDRFNAGYGLISPRNCFKGGQSTNVKMNLIAKENHNNGKTIEIYIYKTDSYIELESILLKKINTKYNAKRSS